MIQVGHKQGYLRKFTTGKYGRIILSSPTRHQVFEIGIIALLLTNPVEIPMLRKTTPPTKYTFLLVG